ncbi:hypothetical protein N9242_01655 [Vicingaceae bacterium]|nr:hypothetical protein [Vicingaceae bacterium]
MKKVNQLLFAITISVFAITTTSCSKEEGCTDSTALNYQSDADEDDGSCNYNGDVSFWQYNGDGLASTSVTIAGETKSITVDMTSTSGPSSCTSSSGNANFTLPSGTHSYTASESGGANTTWSGSITINPNGCTKWRLKN